MAVPQVSWSIEGVPNSDDGMPYVPGSLWRDVRNEIRVRRPDPKPAPENIHVRPARTFHCWLTFAPLCLPQLLLNGFEVNYRERAIEGAELTVKIDAVAAPARVPAAFSTVPYAGSLLSSEAFAFSAPFEPFLFPATIYENDVVRAHFNSLGFQESQDGRVNTGWEIIAVLVKYVVSGSGKLDLVGRTDLFMQLLHSLVGDVNVTRNQYSSATLPDDKIGVTVSSSTYPPFIIIEEKADDSLIDIAYEQIERDAFINVPFYGMLPFVICIAITRGKWRFWTRHRFSAPSQSEPLNVDARDGLALLSLVPVFINIGRWYRWVLANVHSLNMMRLKYTLNCTIERIAGKSVMLTFDGARKMFPLDFDMVDRLKSFYKDCKDVPNLETLCRYEITSHHFHLYLSPLGAEALPQVRDEGTLALAIYCVLTSLAGVHEKGWVHSDVHWGNVVYNPPRFYLIDCECVWKAGTKGFSYELKQRYYPANDVCYPSHDLFLVGRMLDFDPRWLGSELGRRFSDRFADVTRLTAEALLADPWFVFYNCHARMTAM